jgi:hypothetical protein
VKQRDRQTAMGLLPRMEARLWKDGKTITYRYHPVGGKPMKLGSDRQAAIQKVLDLSRKGNDAGTVAELWRLYQGSPDWLLLLRRLAPITPSAAFTSSRPSARLRPAVSAPRT